MVIRRKRIIYSRSKKRQLRIGNYGIADIVTFDKDYNYSHYNESYYPFLNITIFELKKDKVGIGAFLQAIKYCKGIKTYFEIKKPNIKIKLHIVLASKEVDKSGDFIYLTDLINSEDFGYINSIQLYSFKFDINGIKFNLEKGYNLIEKGF